MKVLRKLDELNDACRGGVAMTIGVFDAVHRGHRALIGRAMEKATEKGVKSLVFTFERHPLATLAPAYCPPTVLQPERKARLIGEIGADLCLILDFTSEFAATTAQQFVRDILIGRCGVKFVCCGANFSFGAGAKGNAAFLTEQGKNLGFEVEVMDWVSEGTSMVSSSRIRQSLLQGHVEEAAAMLTQPYGFSARVVTGDQRGRTIGFPTANLLPLPGQLIPADGVYAARIVLADDPKTKSYGAMLNIGVRPTFEGAGRSMEAHLFDFSGDLVGREIEVEFIARIRDERKFGSVAELIEQLKRDEFTGRKILNPN